MFHPSTPLAPSGFAFPPVLPWFLVALESSQSTGTLTPPQVLVAADLPRPLNLQCCLVLSASPRSPDVSAPPWLIPLSIQPWAFLSPVLLASTCIILPSPSPWFLPPSDPHWYSLLPPVIGTFVCLCLHSSPLWLLAQSDPPWYCRLLPVMTLPPKRTMYTLLLPPSNGGNFCHVYLVLI